MKILIAPNSFKESISSVKIAEIISKELSNEKNFQLTTLPLSDGGDGFLEVVKFIYKNEIIEHNFPIEFAGEKFNAPVLVNKSGKEIFIESAEVIGLKKLPQRKRNPLALNTFPLGKLINDLTNNKYSDSIQEFEKIKIGVGGTSTIDFGLGAVNALGIKFLDNNGNEVEPIPANFSLISEIIFPSSFSHPTIQSSNHSIIPPIIHSNIQPSIYSSLLCVVDVQTPLLGDNSAVDLYGLQKGASKNELALIKKGIEHIVELIIKKNLISESEYINGAGGGLASGLKIFFDAEIISANDFIFSNLFRDTSFDEFDFLITGEGKFDIQSFEGKATGEIIRKFSDKVKRIFLVCGRIEQDVKKLIPGNVDCFELLDLYQDEEESKQKVAIGLKIISEKIRDRILK
ncbi:glycerate kinase [Ignavibacterium sp.]|uniref:glycerate kinase n=1 Tax=Ignavibacterium sp. TaxID=2651167 RepID=UPI00220810A9|nr:glycerate kinase [Ignavibacterium sp.]BDQ01582.1 MAG: glycerate kinase [Ignavibacterium sp.]